MSALVDLMNRLGPVRLLTLAGVSIAMIVFFIFLTDRMTRQDMAVLYSDLDIADSGGVVSKLDGLGVPYRIAGDGGTILVPRKDVARLRMAMAEAGVPNGGSIGYELFDQSGGLGATSFTQQINQVRALEGELARSIRTLAPVRTARVHLVLPRREVFSRVEQEPSASIIVALAGAHELSRGQVVGIQQLVAAAVPKLVPSRVAVIDSHGNLLARGGDGENDPSVVSAMNTTTMRQAYESRMASAIERLLERTVGLGKVRTEVSAEMDFDRVTTAAEMFDPDGQVLRSNQVVLEESRIDDGSRVRGVTVDNNLPDAETQEGVAGPGRSTREQRTEETSNYEISKTTKTHVREGGAVRRLSVAVMIDGIHGRAADGTPTWRERPQEELDKLALLVRSAVGFDAERGDRVEVVNLRFADVEADMPAEDTGVVLGLERSDLLRIAEIAVLGIVALLALLMVVRPAIGRILDAIEPPRPGEAEPALLEGQRQHASLAPPDGGYMEGLPTGGEGGGEAGDGGDMPGLADMRPDRVREATLKRIGELIQRHPEETVGIVRNWMYQQS